MLSQTRKEGYACESGFKYVTPMVYAEGMKEKQRVLKTTIRRDVAADESAKLSNSHVRCEHCVIANDKSTDNPMFNVKKVAIGRRIR